MAVILVADDDGHIREVVRFALEKDGHRVVEAADGVAALRACAEHPIDLVVLDIVMPELDGIGVCRKLRERGAMPILFLSSRDEELDRILGLEMGADDYVTKPFSPRELAARVKALLRRASAPPEATDQPLRRGDLVLDLQRHTCHWRAREVLLTVTEFALLRSLMGHVDKVYSRAELVDHAYGLGHAITDRTIDSHVRRIRRKLADAGGDPIETVHGVGYRLRST